MSSLEIEKKRQAVCIIKKSITSQFSGRFMADAARDVVNMKCSWVVYILCCSDGKLYTGVTNNIEKRVSAHNAGEASKFTRARLPVKLLATSRFMTKENVYRLEYRIKKLPRNKKLQALREVSEC